MCYLLLYNVDIIRFLWSVTRKVHFMLGSKIYIMKCLTRRLLIVVFSVVFIFPQVLVYSTLYDVSYENP